MPRSKGVYPITRGGVAQTFRTRGGSSKKPGKRRVIRREVRPPWDYAPLLGYPRIGYNSHGYWAPFREIRETEIEERGNTELVSVADEIPGDWKAIWICVDPRRALKYLDKYFNDYSVEEGPLTEEMREDIEYSLVRIDIEPTDFIAAEDGDGGYLLVRPA